MKSESMLRWPAGVDRTPADERTSTSKFDVGFQRTKKEIRKELQRMGAAKWNLDTVTGSGGDPGVVLRWIDGGDEYAIACDAYASKADNIRAIYLWVNETRMRSDRPVQTANDDFAAAKLPSGDETETRKPPHEILNVAHDADPAVVKASADALIKQYHPDTADDPRPEMVSEVQDARDRMLERA